MPPTRNTRQTDVPQHSHWNGFIIILHLLLLLTLITVVEEEQQQQNNNIMSFPSSSPTTENNNNDHDDSAEAVAARLRDKIRNQAALLLDRVESTLTPSSSSTSKAKRLSTLDAGGSSSSSTDSSSSSSSSPVPHPSSAAERHQDESSNTFPATTLASTPTTPTSAAAATTTTPHSSNSNSELTKRLQKLAIGLQQQTTGDRLKVIQADTSSHLSSVKTFQELNLPPHLLDAIFAMGFDRPSAIQEEALPRILDGRNVIGQAQSGSGKTAAFTLGMLYRITVNEQDNNKNPATTQALCVTPTRELAIQIVDKAVKPMAANMTGLKIQLAVAQEQVHKKRGVDAHLVVGTPGKVVDWLKRKLITPDTIRVFVLDEADTMVDEGGHRANSLLIRKRMPPTCQCLLFSATFPPQVVQFATKMVENPDKILIEEGPEYLMLDIIKQVWVDTRNYSGGKLEFLADIYQLLTIGQSIVFVGTKDQADIVHNTLSQAGFTCSVLHANVDAAGRDETMDAFRRGESNVVR